MAPGLFEHGALAQTAGSITLTTLRSLMLRDKECPSWLPGLLTPSAGPLVGEDGW